MTERDDVAGRLIRQLRGWNDFVDCHRWIDDHQKVAADRLKVAGLPHTFIGLTKTQLRAKKMREEVTSPLAEIEKDPDLPEAVKKSATIIFYCHCFSEDMANENYRSALANLTAVIRFATYVYKLETFPAWNARQKSLDASIAGVDEIKKRVAAKKAAVQRVAKVLQGQYRYRYQLVDAIHSHFKVSTPTTSQPVGQ